MKLIHRVKTILIICVIIGFGVYSVRSSGPGHAQVLSENNSEAADSSVTQRKCAFDDSPLMKEFPNLIEDRCIVKFNGRKLRLDFDYWGIQDRPYLTSDAKIVPLKSGGLLVAFANTLYRLDENYKMVWTVQQGQIMFDFALVESTNLIYGTSGDNTMFILDASTGEEIYSDSRNGSAAYGVAENYGVDMCLVTDNFWFYRQDRSQNYEPMNDGITCWRGTTALWRIDFPPDAELIVSGERILAVTRTEKGVYVKEIIPPAV